MRGVSVYLDANADAPVLPAAWEAYEAALSDFGHPAASHRMGAAAARRLEEARARIAACLEAHPDEVVLTSGGTEADAQVLLAAVGRGEHVVTSNIEHPAVHKTLALLGAEVTAVAAGRDGVVPAEAVLLAVRPETRLVTLVMASNETGVCQPVLEVAAGLARSGAGATALGAITSGAITSGAITPGAITPGAITPGATTPGAITPGAITPGAITPGAITPGAITPGAIAPGAIAPGAITPGAIAPGAIRSDATTPAGTPVGRPLLHTDAVQAAGRIPVRFHMLGVDLLSLAGHKLGAVGGIGAILVRRGTPLTLPQRLDVAGACSLAAALEHAADVRAWAALRDRLEQGLRRLAPDLEIIGAGAPRLPNTTCVRFPGKEGDGLMMALDLQGIAVSTGSACASGSVEPSPVLLAMGYSRTEARQAVRFSLPRETTGEQVDAVLEALAPLLLSA